MSKLSKVMSVYGSCSSLDQKVLCIRWAKRILTGQELEWLGFKLLKTQDFDLVVQHYKQAS